MILKPQDVVVLLKLVAIGPEPWNFQRLAVELSISQSEVHAGVRRAVAARLMSDASTATGKPVRGALLEFLLHGVKYAYPPEHGALTRGVPTGYAAPPLNKVIANSSDPPPGLALCRGQRTRSRFLSAIPVSAGRSHAGLAPLRVACAGGCDSRWTRA